jgi:hypothetical protein
MPTSEAPTTSDTIMNAAIESVKQIRARILFTLSVYPKLSPTHLQVSLGPGTRSSLWHPVLDQLIEEGLVEKIQIRPTEMTPSGRDQIFTVIQLAPKQ